MCLKRTHCFFSVQELSWFQALIFMILYIVKNLIVDFIILNLDL